jgi:hypothetical protein
MALDQGQPPRVMLDRPGRPFDDGLTASASLGRLGAPRRTARFGRRPIEKPERTFAVGDQGLGRGRVRMLRDLAAMTGIPDQFL